ncbi:MAG TPA: hypothetical protein VMH23_18545 [Bacteroidota bacterium]|nr:hypothetical protein [Bacteroidota bacterium]
MRTASFAVLLCVLFSCRATEATGGRELAYQTIAEQKLGKGAECILNSSRSAVLCLMKSKPTQLQPQQQVSFFVFDVGTKAIIFEDVLPNASVKWMDATSVLVLVTPGTQRDNADSVPAGSGYVFDLLTRTTRELRSSDVR